MTGGQSLCATMTDAICDTLGGCLAGGLGPFLKFGPKGPLSRCGLIGAVVGAAVSGCKALGRMFCNYNFGCNDAMPGWGCLALDMATSAVEAMISCGMEAGGGVEDRVELLMTLMFGDIELVTDLVTGC